MPVIRNYIKIYLYKTIKIEIYNMIEHLLTPLVSSRFLEDERYRTGHLRVINPLSDTRVMGVHIPKLKTLASSLSKSVDALDILSAFEAENLAGNLCFEEKIVWGLLINALKVSEKQKLALLESFIPVMDNWAVCDTICCNIKWVKDKKGFWEYLQPYFESDKEFEVRFAIVMSMICFLDKEYFPQVTERIEKLDFKNIHSEFMSPKEVTESSIVRGVAKGERPYYVRMAVAWLLATALYKLPDATRSYVNSSKLPSDVLKLYVRKSKESFRTKNVSPF